MNKDSILSYVKLYQNILEGHKIFLDEQNLEHIYQLILLVFELDDLYDHPEFYPPREPKLAKIKRAMTSLIPNSNLMGIQAIASVFRAMEDESLLTADPTLSLERYLRVSSQSIGASIIMAYLVSKIKLDPSIWYSKAIAKFNYQINVLIRLANDYLDTDQDSSRSIEEIPQVKASSFFAGKSQLKRYLLGKYMVHKFYYYFYQVKYKYLKRSPRSRQYIQAIACSESVLDWAFQVYVIDHNSCQ